MTLYHAVYKPFINKVKRKGLNPNNRNLIIDDSGIILASNLEKMLGIAKTYLDDNINYTDAYIDSLYEQIFILVTNIEMLDKKYLIEKESGIFSYKNIISPDMLDIKNRLLNSDDDFSSLKKITEDYIFS